MKQASEVRTILAFFHGDRDLVSTRSALNERVHEVDLFR